MFRLFWKSVSEDSGKLEMNMEKIREYWEASGETEHPGFPTSNPLGLYGDDCKFNQTGEKLIVISLNAVLHEYTSPSLS